MKAYCAIISPDFVPFAQCLLSSLRRYDSGIQLHVLVTQRESSKTMLNGAHFYSLDDLDNEDIRSFVHQYEGVNDHLRWSLKPVFLLHLLKRIEKLIYVDVDIHFFNDCNFIFDLLEHHSFLLTPHFASTDPFEKEEKFMMNFLVGLYNAGFIAVNRQAINTLQWWLKACLFNTTDDTSHGFFVDQKYLDMIPVIDPAAAIIRHQGCNIGSWNMETYKRVVQADGSVLINGKYPVVFVHFNHETIRHIQSGDDAALQPYLDQYRNTFSLAGVHLEDYIVDLDHWKKSGFFNRIKKNISFRTRIKKLLFNLARKI